MGRFLTLGQPAALGSVERQIGRERPAHALMLVGPPQVGKTTLALDLAAGLQCQEPVPADRPCRECVSCRKVEHGNHPDLHVLRPEGAGEQVKLGQVQELTGTLALLPMEGRFRVAIIESAHRLNPDAQNALLKTLEEPPEATCLILAVDDESVILPTLRSRCAVLRLGTVSSPAVGELLARHGLDASRASSLSRLTAGRPGAALALARAPEASIVHARLSRSLLALVRATTRARVAAARELIAEGALLDELLRPRTEIEAPHPVRVTTTPSARRRAAPASAPRATTRAPAPAERRRAVATLLAVWREVARDLAVTANGGARHVAAVELLEDLTEAASAVDRSEIAAFLERLDTLARAIEGYANPELILDALLLGWPRSRHVA